MIDGARVERILELVNIAANKNTVPGDRSALIPGGLRIGSPAMTSRGLKEKDFTSICEMIHEAIILTKEVNAGVSGKFTFLSHCQPFWNSRSMCCDPS